MRKLWVRRGVVILVLVVLGGWVAVRAVDYLHARVVDARYRAWNAEVERDADGVRTDFSPLVQGQGSAAILFVHGFASPPSIYRHFVPHFADQGFRCEAIRLPGFGETIERASRVSRNDWIDHVTSAAKALRSGHEAVWIVAHSLGGAISLRALHEHPDLADGLVLLAPLFHVSDRRSPMLSPEEWFGIGQEMAIHSRMTEALFPIDAHDERLQLANERDLFTSLNIYVELFALLKELNGARPQPDIPVLMVLSARDEIVDLYAARTWFESLAGDAKRMLIVEPAGHLLPLDTGWEDLLLEIDAFVLEHEAARLER